MPMTIAVASRTELLDCIRRIAADQARVDPLTVSPDTHLCNDLHFDSLDQVEFVMSIEEAFGVTVPDERAAGVRTVGQVADVIADLLLVAQ